MSFAVQRYPTLGAHELNPAIMTKVVLHQGLPIAVAVIGLGRGHKPVR